MILVMRTYITNRLVILLFLILPAFFVYCTKEVEIKLPLHDEKLVLDCLFSPDTTFKLMLSKSSAVFDGNGSDINDAFVVLSKNNIIIDTMFHQNGWYYSIIRPQAGNRYSVVVNANGSTPLSATDILEAKPTFGKTIFFPNVFIDEEGFPVSQVIIEILDDGRNKNYYELVLKNRHKDPHFKHEVIGGVGYARGIDQVLINEADIEYCPGTLVFSNDLFRGQSYSLTINYITQPMYAFSSPDNFLDYDHDLIVSLRLVSETYFMYKKQLTRHLYYQESNIWSGVGDPVPMYTNIEGGYGVFAGYNQVIDTLMNSK